MQLGRTIIFQPSTPRMPPKTVQDEHLELTPRQVAEAIGISESSLKRWCDRGALPSRRTLGGHRRIPVAGVLRFVRERQFVLRNPSILGLPSGLRQRAAAPEALYQQLLDNLTDGHGDDVRRLGIEAFVTSSSLAPLFDDILTPALHEIGRRWQRGTLEIFRERRAVTTIRALLGDLRRLLVVPEAGGAKAIGATLAGDHYEVAVHMGDLVLADVGWQTQTIGSNVPIDSVRVAVESARPSLLWLSLSHVPDVETFVSDYEGLYERAVELGIAVAVGGAALTGELRSRIKATAFGSSMVELAELGRGLLPRQKS